MDPVIRVVCILILIGTLSRNHFDLFLFCAVLIVLLHIVTQQALIKSHLKLLARMRWFFLALMVMYFWFTPGMYLFNSPWSPTVEGLEQGGLRAGSLMLVIIAINLLIQLTPREQILSAIYWILAPLQLLGLPRERFMLRITLTMETMTGMQLLLEAHKDQHNGNKQGKLVSIINKMSDILNIIIQKAESTPVQSVTIVTRRAPVVYQWLFPVILTIIIYIIHTGHG